MTNKTLTEMVKFSAAKLKELVPETSDESIRTVKDVAALIEKQNPELPQSSVEVIYMALADIGGAIDIAMQDEDSD